MKERLFCKENPQIYTPLGKQRFLAHHQNAHSAEPVSGWQRKEPHSSCRTGGAALVWCHPRPATDGRHLNSRIALRDTHAVTAAAAAERQLARTRLCCVRHSCLRWGCAQNKRKTSRCLLPGKHREGRHCCKGEGQEGLEETEFSTTAVILCASSMPPPRTQF